MLRKFFTDLVTKNVHILQKPTETIKHALKKKKKKNIY